MLLCVPAQRREADLVADYHIAFWFSCYCDYITAYRGKSVVGHGGKKCNNIIGTESANGKSEKLELMQTDRQM